MKSKEAEKLIGIYKHGLSNIQLGIDGTDHICFYCPNCKNPLEVIEVISRKVSITTDGKQKDNCSWIYLVCHKCKMLGQRKFYWKEEDGKYCYQKTGRDIKF